MRNLSLLLVVLAATLCVGAGVRYMAADQFMPYHAVVSGKAWSELEPGLRTIILGMLRILAGGFLSCGIALAFLLLPLRRGDRWAPWAVALIGGAVWVPTLLVTFMLRDAAPSAQPPIALTALILGLVLLAATSALIARAPQDLQGGGHGTAPTTR